MQFVKQFHWFILDEMHVYKLEFDELIEQLYYFFWPIKKIIELPIKIFTYKSKVFVQIIRCFLTSVWQVIENRSPIFIFCTRWLSAKYASYLGWSLVFENRISILQIWSQFTSPFSRIPNISLKISLYANLPSLK